MISIFTYEETGAQIRIGRLHSYHIIMTYVWWFIYIFSPYIQPISGIQESLIIISRSHSWQSSESLEPELKPTKSNSGRLVLLEAVL